MCCCLNAFWIAELFEGVRLLSLRNSSDTRLITSDLQGFCFCLLMTAYVTSCSIGIRAMCVSIYLSCSIENKDSASVFITRTRWQTSY